MGGGDMGGGGGGDVGGGGGGDVGGGGGGDTEAGAAFLCRLLVALFLKSPTKLFFIVVIAERTFATTFVRNDISTIAVQNNPPGPYRMHPSWIPPPHPF